MKKEEDVKGKMRDKGNKYKWERRKERRRKRRK